MFRTFFGFLFRFEKGAVRFPVEARDSGQFARDSVTVSVTNTHARLMIDQKCQ